MSKVMLGILGLLIALAMLPFALIARSRATPSPNQEIHLVFDMDNQPRFDPQSTSPVFADGRAMRPQVAGTVAREDMAASSEILNDPNNPHLISADALDFTNASVYANVELGRVRPQGMTDEQFDPLTPPATDKDVTNDKTFYVSTIPTAIKVTPEFVKRGQERFNIYCGPCHGQSGYGNGMIDQHASAIQSAGGDAAGWVHPQNLNDPKILTRTDGHLFNTISNGARSMPAYDKQISVMDRWAIVAYVRALQRSQHAEPGDLAAAPAR